MENSVFEILGYTKDYFVKGKYIGGVVLEKPDRTIYGYAGKVKEILKVPLGKLVKVYLPSESEIVSLWISGMEIITLGNGLLSLSETVPTIVFCAVATSENPIIRAM
jgi:hypothetical protein